jgi:hypothetical protein
MSMQRTALTRLDLTGEPSVKPSRISGSDIMAAWLGVLLINAAVMVATFFR